MEIKIVEPHCNHFVIRKKRFCRMTVKPGEEYCGEHQINQIEEGVGNVAASKRITCPLDPKHTCYADKLRKHLKKCNAKPTTDVAYIKKNINIDNVEDILDNRCLSMVPVSQLLDVIEKINKLHDEIVQSSIREKFTTHVLLEKELLKPGYGAQSKKHLHQTSAILGLLNEYDLLHSDTCFIEFGAGRGKLSYWISKALEEQGYNSSKVLLLERAPHRHKCENKLDNTLVKVVRIRADIADVILSEIEAVRTSKHIVGVTKHLCGDGTDLALNCLINCKNHGKDISGMVMTFCCLHRCRWSTYTGRSFFEVKLMKRSTLDINFIFKEMKITSNEFDVMCSLVSWAVCGSGQSREKRKNCEMDVKYTERDLQVGLDRNEKEIVGKKCKDLINWGRREYLRRHGFICDLYYYVQSAISLENICIIGLKKS
ncbi:hypothetical protein FQA39_LY01591 [Lamprigera yunnana]|nr:hypothetical protein FQA39_LY01591 [Lamprigera yunnana]